jgi:protein-S-isoprenylcysteine O-methyltransferase Ste14
MIVFYKLLAFAVFGIFVFFVFDIRQKPGMVPIVQPIFTRIMKLLSIALFVVYAVVLAGLGELTPLDWVALALTTAGSALVTTAKVTLGRFHTWTGFHLQQTTIVSAGIYSYLRHPLYTGIFLVEFGGLALVTPRLAHVDLRLVPVTLATVLYLMMFNIVMASRESREMARKFGADFDAYRSEVRAFIPIRHARRRSPVAPTQRGAA